MDHALNEEQRLIAETAARLFAAIFPSIVLRDFTQDQEIKDSWRGSLGGSGLLGICAPASVGGAGLGAVDALPILIAAGRHAAPYCVADAIAAAALLAPTQAVISKAIINAEVVVAIAPAIALEVTQDDDSWKLSGVIDAVAWASAAPWMIAEIEFSDAARRSVLIGLDAPGIVRTARKSIDPTCPMTRVALDQYVLPPTQIIGPVNPVWTRLRTIFAAAEMQGAAQTSLNMAVDYMKVRKQFGQQIGRFQALKHIAANDALHIENMRVATEYAAWAHDAGEKDADMAAHIAKEYVSDNARTVAEDAIQCHGGIGFTWDYDLHFYLRRILRLSASLGSATEHREAISTLLVEQFSTR